MLNDNLISDRQELAPLGRMRRLHTLDVRRNPIVEKEEGILNLKEFVVSLQKLMNANEKTKFPALALLNGETIISPEQHQAALEIAAEAPKPPRPKPQDFHLQENKRIQELFHRTKMWQSRNPSPSSSAQKVAPQSVTITAPEMRSSLGLNDRIVFNRTMIKNLSGRDLDNVKI